MLNRRHLRIKVLQILYAYFQSHDKDLRKSEKELFRSIEKMHEMYLLLLLTFEEIEFYANRRIDGRRKNVRPSEEDLHPNKKFVNNRVLQRIKINSELKKKSELLKINWSGDVKSELMKKLFNEVVSSEMHEEYLENGKNDFQDDKDFILKIFKTKIANFDLLHDFFENESIYWMDDIDLVCSMVLKTIKGIEEKETSEFKLLPLYKDEEDEKSFIEILLRNVIENDEENSSLIDELTENWDLDRIAKMDIILLKMALTELTEFESIPKKVTLNEYIEISKFYSTPKSQVFINGVLDKAVELLAKEGKLNKTGRGLIN